MEYKNRLKRALSAIDDAITALKRARNNSDEGRSDWAETGASLDSTLRLG